MGQFAMGQSVPRTEDPRLLRGGGQYVDDIRLPNECHAYMLRSPHAHARITSIDVAAATRQGVAVALAFGTNHEAVADHAFAFLSGSPSPSPPVRLLPRLAPTSRTQHIVGVASRVVKLT